MTDILPLRWPVAGRDAELDAISAALGRSRAQCVVIAGAAGVGKSRLATEAATRLPGAKIAVMRVLATQSASSVPLGAFATVLRGFTDARGEAREGLLQRATAAIVTAARGRTPVLLVDDVHLLDELSAALVLHLVASDAARVVLTLRTPSPVHDSIAALWKEGLCFRIDLEPLTMEQIRCVLVAALGPAIENRTVHLLAEQCKGNALFLTELVHAAVQSGALVQRVGVWRLLGHAPTSQRLTELVLQRVENATPEQRHALDLLALGEPLPLDMFVGLVGTEVAVELESAGYLASLGSGARAQVRLTQPVYAEVLREAMPSIRARQRRALLAEVLSADTNATPEALLTAAVWSLESGATPDPALLMSAAEVARSRFDLDLALRLVDVAANAGGGYRADLTAAELEVLRGMPERAEQRMALLDRSALTQEELGRLTCARMENLIWWLADSARALEVGAEAQAGLTDPRWLAEVNGRRAMACAATGDVGTALQIMAGTDEQAGGTTVLVVGCLTLAGQVHDALALCRQAMARSADGAVPNLPDRMLTNMAAQILIWAGELFGAEEIARPAYDEALAAGASHDQGLFAKNLGQIYLARGELEPALQWAVEASSLLAATGPLRRLPTFLLAQTLAVAGRPAEARDVLAEADRGPAMRMYDSYREIALGWVATAEGDSAVARAIFLQAAEAAERNGALVPALTALHDCARIGFPADVVDSLERVAPDVEGPLARIKLEHVRALVRSDGHALLAVAERFQQMGYRVAASEAAGEAATAFNRAGLDAEAAEAHRNATRLSRAISGASTPGLAALKVGAQLTATERSIASLAASGYSNKQIAERRSVSVRTVENHLQRAYVKLGITSRAQLAEALG